MGMQHTSNATMMPAAAAPRRYQDLRLIEIKVPIATFHIARPIASLISLSFVLDMIIS